MAFALELLRRAGQRPSFERMPDFPCCTSSFCAALAKLSRLMRVTDAVLQALRIFLILASPDLGLVLAQLRTQELEEEHALPLRWRISSPHRCEELFTAFWHGGCWGLDRWQPPEGGHAADAHMSPIGLSAQRSSQGLFPCGTDRRHRFGLPRSGLAEPEGWSRSWWQPGTSVCFPNWRLMYGPGTSLSLATELSGVALRDT